MARRYSLKYEYSKDGVTWIDFSDAVDSRQTKITQSLCTMGFKSAKDSVTFTLPATSLPVKNQLVADLLGPDNLYFRMDIPSPVPVLWDGNQVLWNSNEVFWRGLARGFTGYIDKTSVNLQSYPLPTSLTLTAYDVSFLNLDNKVNKNLLYEDYSITTIVHELLTEAGYSYDLSALNPADDITLEAFVVDKEKAKTYREYIDTLLFEAGGYVLDFTPEGIARIVHLPWDDANGPSRVIDNPMNEGGIQIKSEYLKEDGVKLKWATLAWSDPDRRIYDASISRKWNNGLIEGDTINAGAYWPKDGDVNPIYMQYSAEWLDEPYLKLDTRKQNEDLSIIMAKNVYAKYYADKNGVEYLFPEPYAVPAQYQTDPYNFTSNPMIWPLKAWFLLKNETAGPINLASFELCGETLFRSKINTLQTADSENPKEYTSEYIFDATQAQNFLDFYWHFLQTSRFTMSWSEPLNSGNLGDVVEITQKGMAYTQDAVVVAKTVQFINDLTPIVQYSAVGVAVPVLASGVAYSVAPPASAANPSMEEMALEQKVDELETDVENWDFAIEQSAVLRNDRIPWNPNDSDSYTDIHLTSLQKGYNLLEYWSCDGTPSPLLTYFVGANAQTTTGSTPILRIYKQETYEEIKVTMHSLDNTHSITKVIKINNETEYDHDFGAWEPTDDGTNIFVLPDHFTDGGIDYDIIQGDFFVAKKTFAVYSEGSAVTPSGTEDPADLGWYERKGNGTNAKPYYWLLTADTSVDAGKTYGTVSGQAYTEGSPYQYASNSWYNPITATTQNARKMLSCLANVLSDPNIQPSTSALYAWFENLVAKNAVLENLVAMFLQVGPGTGLAGSGFRFRALNDDGNGSPVFDVYYGDSMLFSVNPATGNIYFGTGFWYDPNDSAIHSTGDGVVIDSSGTITINEGLYKSNLVCPSFRSLPRSTPITPTSYTISGSASSQNSQMQSIGLSANVVYPCTHSIDSSVKYVRYSSGPTYNFYNQNMMSVGQIYTSYSSLGPTYSSTWAGSTFTLSIGVQSNAVFKLLGEDGNLTIPSSASISSLEKGELYYVADSGGTTGTLHIKL